MDRLRIAASSLLVLFALISSASAEGFAKLFDGESLDGWVQRGGQATYEVDATAEGGPQIVGTSVPDTPNSFLCTDRDYADFVLEFEVLVDPVLNSGVQFRSACFDEPTTSEGVSIAPGRVHGYQAEVDPSPRAYSGGVYDEARRGWLYSLANNPEGREAFVAGRWNKYRVEAIGTEIRIWINGIQTANVIDDMTSTGFIALQVHSIPNRKELAGREVRWRNIRIKTTDLEKARWKASPHAPEINWIPNTLSAHEKRTGWRMLWDGKSSKGWRSARGSEFPTQGWEMEDGVLTVLASDGAESANGGEWCLHWRIADWPKNESLSKGPEKFDQANPFDRQKKILVV